MHRVNADEVKRLKTRLREINRIPLEQIIWEDDLGKPISIHPEDVVNWKFCGLNNSDFVELVVHMDKDSEGRAMRITDGS